MWGAPYCCLARLVKLPRAASEGKQTSSEEIGATHCDQIIHRRLQHQMESSSATSATHRGLAGHLDLGFHQLLREDRGKAFHHEAELQAEKGTGVVRDERRLI
ncbi:hypothetical protein AVEN_151080-1 [Araneus ventricosus]|uniref:Uncharacterized protein n=1 Tax=Araneus ventricosus TaxID=182803 RepID=A0A4Y2SXS1_ARAVE|nr:hypothetical protein AVEN_151080-1 [Araneus ventricosus]